MTVDVPQRTAIDLPVPSGAVATRTEELIIKEARRRHRRRVLAIAGTITMLIAGVGIAVVNLVGHGSPATQPSPLSTRPRQPPPLPGTRCQNGQVSVTLLSAGAGAGQRDEVFGFSNVSKTSCTVTGYPLLSPSMPKEPRAQPQSRCWKALAVSTLAPLHLLPSR
jgi:Protein of unknown function (DUF4232)